MLKLGAESFGCRHLIAGMRSMTPNWFTISMGTGVIVQLLTTLAGRSAWLHGLAFGIFVVNILIYLALFILLSGRFIIDFKQAIQLLKHPQQSLFFGAVPMALSGLINGTLVFFTPSLHEFGLNLIQMLWWINVLMALTTGVVIPWAMFSYQQHQLSNMTALWLLPLVAAGVAGVTGANLAPLLSDAAERSQTLIISYLLWAYSLPLAFSVLVILLLRMAVHQLPDVVMAPSCWLALGPVATGSLEMLILAQQDPTQLTLGLIGQYRAILAGGSLLLGIIMWGIASWWFLLSVLITCRYLSQGIPFNTGWWGYIFPAGIYSLASLKIGMLLNINFFIILGQGIALFLIPVWLIVSGKTIRLVIRR